MEKGDNKKCEQSAGACNDGKFYGRFPNQYITVGKKKKRDFFLYLDYYNKCRRSSISMFATMRLEAVIITELYDYTQTHEYT